MNETNKDEDIRVTETTDKENNENPVEEKTTNEEKEETFEVKKTHLLIKDLIIDNPDLYLENGVMVGLKYKTSDMRPYIYSIKIVKTPTGYGKISVFDIAKIDNRIKIAAKFLSRYNPKDVWVISNRFYGKKPASTFAKYCGFNFIEERFVSGSLTNPNIKQYIEPKIILVTDPYSDKQVIEEAAQMNIPIIAICNSNARFKNIDFVIPGNNRTKNSLAMIFWLLTKEMSKIKGFEFKTECPRAITTDEQGNEIPQDNEFLSQGEPPEYKVRMQQINKLLLIKRKLKRRGKKKTKREKKLVIL